MDEAKLKIIAENPIGNGLDAFRNEFASICGSMGLVCSPDGFDQLEQGRRRNIAYDILTTLPRLKAVRFLRSASGDKSLLDDILRVTSVVSSDDFDLGRIKPLLKAVLDNPDDDVAVWTQVYKAFSEATPPPPLIPPSVASLPTTATIATADISATAATAAAAATTDSADARGTVATSAATNTPSVPETISILNSSEVCREVDPIRKRELGNPRVGIRRFRESFFARVPGLERVAAIVFDKCCEGDEPVFRQDGWDGWPAEAREGDVLAWFGNTITKLEELAADHRPANLTYRRKLLVQPRTPLLGSTGRRSVDIGFVNDDFEPKPGREGRYRWSHILVPGELKSNPLADAPPLAWIDLATYVREVFSAQDTRRFALAFTLCGSNLRLWEYDRLGGMASEQFNINEPKGGLEFVAAMLGFLWMDEEGLGFDPSFMESEGKRFIEIQRHGKLERLIIDGVITRPRCIASRATTCWKAHREDDPLKSPLVIKDSWQYPERDEEGLLVKEATDKGVVNVARYYHHETVHIGGVEDEIRTLIRKELDTLAAATDTTAERPAKRSRLESVKSSDAKTITNRVHRRVVLQDYGRPIYTASSPTALLAALESCIRGHESLRRQAGLLHRDISINNVVIDKDGPADRKGFLIDLDLAIEEQRIEGSGAKGKTGTRAFMAIGVLIGQQQHSFMHDLESFFWVLFWICIHHDGTDKARVTDFDEWNFMKDHNLAGVKMLTIYNSKLFCSKAEASFTPFYAPLIPLMDELRAVVFPNGQPWTEPDEGLYSAMRKILLQDLE
ncbi:serine/threonine-protein kinase Sgk2 [Trichoderma sp. SZMC 28014]